MAVLSSFSKRLSSVVKEIGRKKGDGGWYGPHMAASERAIRERIPMVDLVLEVRDARIPMASAFKSAWHDMDSSRHMIILNKMDLADCSLTEEWTVHFQKQNHICLGVNSHNNESINQLLNAVKKRTRDLKVGEIQNTSTATVLLVGIPNVGKSAIANSMHLIGRIDAAEKGKLKHAVVSPQPGETRDIRSYKIASHPNIYVFDTPGVLSAEIADDDSGSKLALAGAIKDSLIGEYNLARFLLAVLSSSDVYKSWEGLKRAWDQVLLSNTQTGKFVDSDQKRRRQYESDHTQDSIVSDVRQTLFESISSLKLHQEKEEEMERFMDVAFTVLCEPLRILNKSEEDRCKVVASKLLNLYRTGRLGRYTLDIAPRNA
ncbi:DAR GTPase 2, mitochondrial isoform X2 [Phalaenopsis equestris]|uniref:DAR GTPase 2, mitochondrial isoform X2 n=1 Tax=Phalaenopsis equestris TaxID=78828 RepID=UPI0009E191F5|nr:DAR GTPase 2, mitochondrial isoform X2 [Phalaenopsis equestris]